MNMFSSPAFLEGLAAAYFPGRRTVVRDAGLEGDTFRLLEVDGGQLITHWHFVDFLEPAATAVGSPGRAVSYISRVARPRVTVAQWRERDLAESHQASPLVDFTTLGSPQAFESLVKGRRSNAFADARRRRRRLEESLGPLEFDYEDRRPESLETCLRWKSAQYVASGLPDLFAPGPHLELFRLLARSGFLRVASLRAGGRIVAAHLGAFEEGRFYYWIPAYDPEMTFYSPGRLLLDGLLRETLDRGASEFDFLIGDEDYKWLYATHVRPVGPRGRPPLRVVARRSVGQALRRVLASSPAAYDFARRLGRRFV